MTPQPAHIPSLPQEWKLPANLAIGLHLLVMVSVVVLPQFLNKREIIEEITTIDLVGMPEPPAPGQPNTQPPAKEAPKESAPPKPAETIKPEATKQVPPPPETPEAIPIPEPQPAPPEPVVPPAPPEAISIKPLKQKIKKEIKEPPPPKPEDVKKRQEELKDIAKKLQEDARKETAAQETIRKQRELAAAREEARNAELAARLAAAEAKNALRDQLRTSARSGAGGTTGTATSSSGQNMGVLEQQYYATISGHIQQHWQPPDVKSWEASLVAIVSITISSDGQIIHREFEKESGDPLFDQFVLKTLDASNPLPAPPPALQKQRLEIGLKFKPSGIQ